MPARKELPWWGEPSDQPPGEAARKLGLWRPDSRPHGWVGGTYGPIELIRPAPAKNPGGEATKANATPATGLIDPWREAR